MTIVFDDLNGFTIDWDRRCGLTVWTVRGAWFGRDICTHELGSRPAGLPQARRAARRWWATGGRDQALKHTSAAAGAEDDPPAR